MQFSVKILLARTVVKAPTFYAIENFAGKNNQYLEHSSFMRILTIKLLYRAL